MYVATVPAKKLWRAKFVLDLLDPVSLGAVGHWEQLHRAYTLVHRISLLLDLLHLLLPLQTTLPLRDTDQGRILSKLVDILQEGLGLIYKRHVPEHPLRPVALAPPHQLRTHVAVGILALEAAEELHRFL